MKAKYVSALGGCVMAAQLLAGAVSVRAHSFPTKPVRLIVPVPAGAGADFVCRHLLAGNSSLVTHHAFEISENDDDE